MKQTEILESEKSHIIADFIDFANRRGVVWPPAGSAALRYEYLGIDLDALEMEKWTEQQQ